MSYRRRRRHSQGSSRRSDRRRTGSDHWNAILRHDSSGRAIAKCWPGCAPLGVLQRIGIESTGSYGAGLLRFMQQAKVTVLEVTTWTSRIGVGVARTTISTRRTPPMPPLQASGPPRSCVVDGMIESPTGSRMACRKTAVSARRVALQMIHNTIVCAPDGLRDQLRSLTRMQLVRTLASWRRGSDSISRPGIRLSHRPQIPCSPLPRTA